MKKVVKFKKLNKDAIIPDYAHKGDAGMDLYSIQDDIIEPLTWKLIPTGLACELPEGTEGQVRSKSGIALKNGVFVLNTPGTVDENYRGEIGVVLYNLNTKEPFVIKKGQKIAQYVINAIEYVDTIEVEQLDSTDRGEGGFGSTGLGKNKKN
ncbi:MAG: dUTP diphosphatase [Eubacteriales bacterium]|nr:dUTP diphosphatase [Clostridia bacterium]MDY2695848.1 dUTP diphosphatase [Eubacteriales bacterium]